MSTKELAFVFLIVFVLQLLVNGYLAWKVRQMEGWFRAVINAGYRKEKDARR